MKVKYMKMPYNERMQSDKSSAADYDKSLSLAPEYSFISDCFLVSKR
jgi:hypothetical protein